MTRPLVFLVTGLVAMAVAVGASALSTSRDPREAACIRAKTLAVFELARARDYRVALPHMGLSPELEVDSPALVVVYAEPIELPAFGGARAESPEGRVYSGVVCVVVGTTPTLYVNVDTSDSPVLAEIDGS